MAAQRVLAWPALAALACAPCVLGDAPPVRGLHLLTPKPADVPLLVRFIREAMPKEGVNTLVLETDYHYQFKSHPEVTDPDALSSEDAAAIVAAARSAGVRVIPEINLLGHQSWAKVTYGLLRSHPEFDETPGRYPDNAGIYCRSYCPLHPGVHKIVFDLIDELVAAFGADAFHAGMDEVFILGDNDCPRCKGRLAADLYANEVRTIHDHLAQSHIQMWMWGDRLIDGATSGAGEWEGSYNQTWPAIGQIPKDIVIGDWHYESALPGAAYFAMHGFNVVSCSWRQTDVALAQVDLIRTLRAHANPEVAARIQGLLHTTWGDPADFIRAYFGEPPATPSVGDSVKCFRAAMARLRADSASAPK
jgi:hypothetical protein